MNQITAIAKQELRLLTRERDMLAVFIFLPLVIIAFVGPLLQETITREGYPGRSGVDLAVPGMAILFAFTFVGYLGTMFFREYGWNTWPRLVASRASSWELLLGRAGPAVLLLLLQGAILFSGGWIGFRFNVRGSIPALFLVDVALALCAVAFGFLIVALSPSVRHVNLFTNLGAMVLAGVGGAVIPLNDLPSWVWPVSRWTPSYWANHAFRLVVLDGKGFSAVAPAAALLLGFSLLFVTAGVLAFNLEDQKVSR